MSDKAIMHAVEMAKVTNAEIILLHVIEEIKVPPTLLLGNDRVFATKGKEKHCKRNGAKLGQICPREVKLFSSDKLKISADSKIGDPSEQITNYANENGVDMIIMGSRRLAGASKLLLALGRSMARKVSEKAPPCPVMLIR